LHDAIGHLERTMGGIGAVSRIAIIGGLQLGKIARRKELFWWCNIGVLTQC
jgi:hypothetical protein